MIDVRYERERISGLLAAHGMQIIACRKGRDRKIGCTFYDREGNVKAARGTDYREVYTRISRWIEALDDAAEQGPSEDEWIDASSHHSYWRQP